MYFDEIFFINFFFTFFIFQIACENTDNGIKTTKNDFLFRINRTKSNQRWMKLRTTVQLSSAIQKKPPLKREDSFLKRFSTRQIPETQVIDGE